MTTIDTRTQSKTITLLFDDNGIYHDWLDAKGTGPDDPYITIEEESLQCNPDGDLDLLLSKAEVEIVEELNRLEPNCKSGELEVTFAYIAWQWLKVVRECRDTGDVDRAIQAQHWLAINLERMRVDRLQHHALSGKEWERGRAKGPKARSQKAAEDRSRLREEAQAAVAAAEKELSRDGASPQQEAIMRVACETLGIGRSTLYRRLQPEKEKDVDKPATGHSPD